MAETYSLDETKVVLLHGYKSTTNFVSCVQTPTSKPRDSSRIKSETPTAPTANTLQNEPVKLNPRRRQRRKNINFNNKLQQIDSKKTSISRPHHGAPQNDLSDINSNDIKNQTESKPIPAKPWDALKNKLSLQKSASESDSEPKHQLPQFYETLGVDSSSDKSYKASVLNGEYYRQQLASKECSVYSYSHVPCSGERTKTNPRKKQRSKLETSNIRESETQTEESSFSIIGRSKLATQNSSTQTYFQTSNHFTQTVDTLLTECKFVPNEEYSTEAFIKQGVQSEPKKVKKRVTFAESVDEQILEWTQISNEPLWRKPLPWSALNQFCEETEIRKKDNLKELHCNNVETKLVSPLVDICPNPELGLMGALGLTQNMSKKTILSKSNQNLGLEEFNNQNVTLGANGNTSTNRMSQSKPVKSIFKNRLSNNLEQCSPPCITILNEKAFAGRTEESVNALATMNFSNQFLPANKDTMPESGLSKPLEHHKFKYNKKTNVKRQYYAKETFNISISDVLPRYRSFSNEIIRTTVEIAQILGVKSTPHMENGYNNPLQPTEEVSIFYSGCGDDLHYVTVDIWNRTVKLYSHDNITLSIVENIAKEKLDPTKIVGIWNLGIQRVWYYTLVDIDYKLKVVEENSRTQNFQEHKYIFTNMTTEGFQLCKYSINYFIKKAKRLMNENRTLELTV